MDKLLIIGGAMDPRLQEIAGEDKLLERFLKNFEKTTCKGATAKGATAQDNPHFWFATPEPYYPFKTKPVLHHRVSDESIIGLAELILEQEARGLGISSETTSLHAMLNERWQLRDPHLFDDYSMIALSTTYVLPPIILYLLRSLPIPSHVKIFVGGPGAVKLSHADLPQLKFSYLLRSESEGRFNQLLRHAMGEEVDLEKIAGLSWREGDKIRHSSQPYAYVDLNEVPLVDMHRVAQSREGRVLYESARGCPYRCAFCDYPFLMNNNRYRFKSAEKIHQDWQEMYEVMGARDILCLDSTFTCPPKRIRALCNLLCQSGLNEKIRWGCYARADDLGIDGIAEHMREAGCAYVYIGFESGSDDVLKYMNKGCTVEDNRTAVLNCNKVGIMIFGLFIAGFPGETPEMFEETKTFLREFPPSVLSLVPWIPDFAEDSKVPVMQPACGEEFKIELETPSRKQVTMWNNCSFKAPTSRPWGFYWTHRGMDLQMACDFISGVIQDIYDQNIRTISEELFLPRLIDDPLTLYQTLGAERAIDFYLGLTRLVLNDEPQGFADWRQKIELVCD